jgi:hypothetical protein
MRPLVIAAFALILLPALMQGQRMASAYPNLQAFIDSCPQNDPYTPIIRHDFLIMRNQVPVGNIVCSEPVSQMPTSKITDELRVIQTLRFIYYIDMGRTGYLPWTQLRLYDWMKATISGINIDDNDGNFDFCCEFANNVTSFSVESIEEGAASNGTPVAEAMQLSLDALGLAANAALYAHETRHSNGNGYHHVSGCPSWPDGQPYCDEEYNLANLSPFGIQYYLFQQMATGGMNLGYSCDSTTRADLGGQFVRAANGYPPIFVTKPPPAISLPPEPGGVCIPAARFTLTAVPSQVTPGSSLTVRVGASNAQAGWTAASPDTWIVPTSGMNSVGNGQATFSLHPKSSTESGTVIVAGQTLAVSCANSHCDVSELNIISFGPLNNTAIGAAPFTVSASASSGLPVTLESTTPAVCTVSGLKVTIVGAGKCSITATQAGNATHLAAAPVTQNFTVTGETPQSISFEPLNNVTVAVAPFIIGATASSGLSVTLNAVDTTVCTLSESTVTILSEGTCWITAVQNGNSHYSAATPVFQSFRVFGAAQLVWGLSATFNDGGTAIGYFVYDLNENFYTYWDVSTAGGNTSTFFPFEFTPENSAIGYIANSGSGPTILMRSNSSFTSQVPGPSEPLVFEPTLASQISGNEGTIKILPGKSNYIGWGTVSAECFSCYPYRNITKGVVTTSGPLLPTVTATPSPTRITKAQPLTVTVVVSGGSGNPTPTGTVKLTGGGYISGAITLVSGSAKISMPAGSLATGNDTLSVGYSPDSASSFTYKSATNKTSVTVTELSPAESVTPSLLW